MGGQPYALLSSRTPNEKLSFGNGAKCQEWLCLPLQSQTRPSWGALYGKSGDTVVWIVSGWDPKAKLSEANCKQSDLEESETLDRATETLIGGISLGPIFGDACEPEGSSERQAGLSGETWMKSVPHKMALRETSEPH